MGEGRALRLGLSRGRALRLEQARWRALRLGKTWKVAAWKIAQLGIFHLGKYPWEVARRLGKTFGKVPNILDIACSVPFTC